MTEYLSQIEGREIIERIPADAFEQALYRHWLRTTVAQQDDGLVITIGDYLGDGRWVLYASPVTIGLFDHLGPSGWVALVEHLYPASESYRVYVVWHWDGHPGWHAPSGDTGYRDGDGSEVFDQTKLDIAIGTLVLS